MHHALEGLQNTGVKDSRLFCCHVVTVKREVVQKDCQARKLSRVSAMDRGRWSKLIKDG